MQNKKFKSKAQNIRKENDYQNYKDKRVLQRNLVFVYGLPEELSQIEILQSEQFLGQYGKIVEIYIYEDNNKKKSNKNEKKIFNAHVTYLTNQQACQAILCLNTLNINGKCLKATFGLTKFCFFYLKGGNCQRSNCNFHHGSVNDCDIVDIRDQNDQRIKKMDINDIIEYITKHDIPMQNLYDLHNTKYFIFPPSQYAQEMIQKNLNYNQHLQNNYTQKPQNIINNINKFYQGHNQNLDNNLLRAQSYNQVSSLTDLRQLTKTNSVKDHKFKEQKKSLSQTKQQMKSGNFSTDYSLNEDEQSQANVYYTNYLFQQQQQTNRNKKFSQDQLSDCPWFL